MHHRKMKTLRRQISDLEASVYGFGSDFSFFTKVRIKAFLKKSLDNYIFSVKATHSRKLSDLGLHSTDNVNDSAIYNDTDIIFSEDEIKLLSKGLKFCYFPDRIKLKQIQAEFENLFIQLSFHIKSQNNLTKLKVCLVNGYSNFVSSFFFDRRTDRNFSKNIHDLISSIREKVEKYNLVVIRADKGNTVVIIRRTNYVSKMLNILSDTSKFKCVNEESSIDRLRKFQSFLRYHHKQGVFTDDEYAELFPTSTSIPTMYGLPKTHKAGIPLRPILSMAGCFNHAFAKWIGKRLERLREAKSIARDSFSLGFLGSPNLTDGYFVSYDVVSLFTNIPLDQTIDLTLNQLYPRNSGVPAKDQRFAGMSKTIFKRSLDWCLRNNTFIFDGKYYVQTDGIAMGSPLAPILADIFMNHVLESKITRESDGNNNFLDVIFNSHNNFEQFNLRLFVRYVDDTLAVFNNRSDALRFLDYLNSLHENLEFTMEQECDDKIPFLDLLIIRNRDTNCIDLTVYRKPTHSGVFTDFTSFSPFHYKMGLVRTLVTRAYRLCSTWTLFDLEIKEITKLLMQNGYTRSFIENIVKSQLDKLYSDEPYKKFGPEPKHIFIRLPYLGDASSRLLGSINSCLNQFKLGTISVKILHNFSRLEGNFHFKDKQPKHLLNGVVYQITCSCGLRYVGETSRCLKVRFDEHCKKEGTNMTEVGKHLAESPDHTIAFDEVKVLAFEQSTRKRRYLESLFIQDSLSKYDLLNDNHKSIPLYLFNLPPFYRSNNNA